MIIDGVAGSACWDSAGEVLDIEGADVSDVDKGTLLLNWNHPGEKNDSPSALVGKVTYCKKIFKREDCENDRQRMYWDKTEAPLIYIIGRLWDKAGHRAAQDLAAIIRDQADHNEALVCRFSVDGVTLKKEGNVLKKTIIKQVAIAVAPANKTAISGLLTDEAAPEGYKKEHDKKVKDILADIVETKKFEHPEKTKLSMGGEVGILPEIDRRLIKALTKKAFLRKAITAGSGAGAAPSQLVGGAALQREELGQKINKEEFTDDGERLYYHGTPHKFGAFEPRRGWYTTTFTEPQQVQRAGFFFSDHPEHAKEYAGKGGRIIAAHLNNQESIDLSRVPWDLEESIANGHGPRGRRPDFDIHNHLAKYGLKLSDFRGMKPWQAFEGDLGRRFVEALKGAGYDSAEFHEEHGVPGAKPKTYVVFSPDQIHQLNEVKKSEVNIMDGVSDDEVKALAAKLGVDLQKIPFDQFKEGVAHEREHAEVTHGDAADTARIALDHLKEDPLYYRKIAELEKKQKEALISQVKAAVRDYKPEHGSLKTFMKSRLPEVSDDYIDHFVSVADDVRAKLKKSHNDLVDEIWGQHDEPSKPASEDNLPDEVLPDPSAVQFPPEDPKKAPKPTLTVRGKKVRPNPAMKPGNVHFHEPSGTLKTARGSFKLYNPDNDPKGKDTFRDAWHSEAVRKQHDYAVHNWLKVNQALRDGKLPESIVSTATVFSQLSPNTPVGMHELMYAYLVDTMNHLGVKPQDPEFGTERVRRDWMGRDKPHSLPQHSHDYFKNDINQLVTNASDSVLTSRKKGETSAFMLPGNKFKNMSRYHEIHDKLLDLVSRHGTDARSAVAELMENKKAAGTKKGRQIGAWVVPGLAPKTARFTYAMLGGGNVFVPDTHFTRHLMGFDKTLDANTIDHIRNNVFWGEKNSDILSGMDRWYFKNHPAVKLMLEHPEFGKYFRANPEQAIFPAFWGHWLAISKDEAARGLGGANVAYNQQASHRPIFEEIQRIMADPKEKLFDVKPGEPPPAPKPGWIKKSEEASIHPVHAAMLLHDWYNKLGPAAASFKFYTHLVPLLWTEPQDPLLKAESLSVELHGVLEVLEKHGIQLEKSEDGHVEFNGKTIKPGKLRVFGSPDSYAVLHADDNHVVAVPGGKVNGWQEKDLLKLNRSHEGVRYRLYSHPHDPSAHPVIDAEIHGRWNQSPEQKKLIHGLDLTKNMRAPLRADTGGGNWKKTDSGLVYVKEDADASQEGSPQREVLYHNLAHSFFGLGNFIPTTAGAVDPSNGKMISVMAAVPDAEHMHQTSDPAHMEVLARHAGTGDLDRIAIMDMVLGNADRHWGNWVYAPHHEKRLQLIDHGGAFDYQNSPHEGELGLHDLLRKRRPGVIDQNIHPEASKWALSLDPKQLAAQILGHTGVPQQFARHAAVSLAQLQNAMKHGPMRRDRIWDHEA